MGLRAGEALAFKTTSPNAYSQAVCGPGMASELLKPVEHGLYFTSFHIWYCVVCVHVT